MHSGKPFLNPTTLDSVSGRLCLRAKFELTEVIVVDVPALSRRQTWRTSLKSLLHLSSFFRRRTNFAAARCLANASYWFGSGSVSPANSFVWCAWSQAQFRSQRESERRTVGHSRVRDVPSTTKLWCLGLKRSTLRQWTPFTQHNSNYRRTIRGMSFTPCSPTTWKATTSMTL